MKYLRLILLCLFSLPSFAQVIGGACGLTGQTGITYYGQPVICSSGTWQIPGTGGSGTPAGSDNQVQFNNSAAFGASANLQWVHASNDLLVGNGTNRATAGIQVGAGDPNTITGVVSDYARFLVAENFTGTGAGSSAFGDYSVFSRSGGGEYASFIASPYITSTSGAPNYCGLCFNPSVRSGDTAGGFLGMDWEPDITGTAAHVYGIYGRQITGSGTISGGGALIDLEQAISSTLTIGSGYSFFVNNCTHYAANGNPAAPANNSSGCRSSFGDATAMFGGVDNLTFNDVIYVDHNNTGAHQLTDRHVNGFANSTVWGNTGGTTFLGIDGSKGTVSTYNSIATTGNGVGSVVASTGAVTIGSGTSIAATSLCSTTQCPSGRYEVKVYIDLTTACSTTGTYIPWLGYTDDAGAKAGSSTTTGFSAAGGLGVTPATASAFATLDLSTTTHFLTGDYFVNTTGAATGGLGAINYGTTATACGTGGPMVGKMYFDVIKME